MTHFLKGDSWEKKQKARFIFRELKVTYQSLKTLLKRFF